MFAYPVAICCIYPNNGLLESCIYTNSIGSYAESTARPGKHIKRDGVKFRAHLMFLISPS